MFIVGVWYLHNRLYITCTQPTHMSDKKNTIYTTPTQQWYNNPLHGVGTPCEGLLYYCCVGVVHQSSLLSETHSLRWVPLMWIVVHKLCTTYCAASFFFREMIPTLISHNNFISPFNRFSTKTKRKQNKTKKIIKYYQPHQLTVGLLWEMSVEIISLFFIVMVWQDGCSQPVEPTHTVINAWMFFFVMF
jgi:hypothetical protein